MAIGVLGIGIMGEQAAIRLLKAEREVVVYNRTIEKIERVKKQGALVATTPGEAIQNSEAVLLFLADAEAIRQVLLERTVLDRLEGRTVIQMGTIGPDESVGIMEQVHKAGGKYLEAPVLGSVPHIKTGKLKVLVGCEEALFNQWEDLLKLFGTVYFIGHVGSAAMMKLARNQLIAALMSAYSLSLACLQQSGLSSDRFMEILRVDALYTPLLDKKLKSMTEGPYTEASFAIKHLTKDVDLFLEEVYRHNLDPRPLTGIRDVLEKAANLGWEEADYAAIYGAVLGHAPER